MNVLVNYASDSDSETEQKTPSTRRHVPQTKDDVDNDFVLAALKDIQSFAASTETSPSKDNSESTQRTTDGPIAATAGDTSVDDLGFLSFLKEIDAIPCPPEDQAQAAPPPPSPPSTPPTVDCVVPPPPPPSLPTIQADDGESVLELASRDTKTIYTQMYHLWLLPSISIDQKDLERRLLEFAIRIRDWEKGGLYEHYFLGKDRAGTVSIAGSSSIVELPPYGGVVGSMIKQLYELEQMAAPSGWTAVWDTEDEAYGFHHIRTGGPGQ
ncbi:hypothetical protein BC939DRAFT_476696 [Gamsiella multidivaricata]|uniref:uncharacterized protein n=1 Tax=Gamsiella multidivaricata TaxID=101098 RepID=UPI00221F59AB|nr:uncharacterized protein BC939DRAFT_476696 [Gamsiella multidivaricata]KAI7824730.1 hypothetical protein BC939DRAFT_476696 [Gamsiella multidivaricata]